MNNLHLILKKKWFDEIKSGRKRTEYREYKPFWIKRLEGKKFDTITFQLGYTSDAPRMNFKWTGMEFITHPDFGRVYAISFSE